MGMRRRKLGIWLLASIVVIVAVRLLAAPILNAYARWLIVEEPFDRVDVALVLGGGEGERLAAAIHLYRSEKAGGIVILGPDAPLLKVYTGEDSLTQGEAKRRIAIKRGVPDSVVTLVLGAQSTYEEATMALEAARKESWKSVAVVTSPFHTRRALATFQSVFHDPGVEIKIFHLPIERSSQDPNRWWRRESDTMAVITETIKIGFYAYRYRIWPWI
jgi:uncharacterized SAM-binding protein YcdF (DUF218 family)